MTLTDSASYTAPLPRAFGGYLLLRPIGEGGMGVVYQAIQERLGRVVALKLIRGGQGEDPSVRERFRQEAAAVARLRHANIVTVYESGEVEGRMYFSMEYLDGGTLARRWSAQPPTVREATSVVRTLSGAVAAAHRARLVHRDLKPSNVLFDRDGTAKVTDFGVAKLLDSSDGLTGSEAVLGTPSYMAPEQARGDSRAVGPPADVWALGAMLYQGLTGQPPFKADTRTETLFQVINREPVPPSRLAPPLSHDLEAVCMKCLEKNPKRRYASADDLAADLARWERGEPTLARPVGWFGRQARRARRHRAVVAALLFGAVLAAAVPVYSHYTDPDRPIKLATRKLQDGRQVVLVGETGPALWHSFFVGKADVVASPNRALEVRGTSVPCLIELMPDPGIVAYRFRAEIRQDTGELVGSIGLYFEGRAAGGLYGYCLLTHDEHRALRRGRDANLELALACTDGAIRFPFTGPALATIRFTPGPGVWHRLLIDVTPAGVRGAIDDLKLDPVSRAEMGRDVSRSSGFPGGGGMPRAFAPKGQSLGLYVESASFSVRSVVVEPLP
jgi:hypothetical protein